MLVVGETTGCASAAQSTPPPVVIGPAASQPPPPAAGATPTTEPKQGDEPPITWERSEPEAKERARREQRPMIVFLRADWAAAALELERAVWADPAVRRAARRFVTVKIDVTAAQADAEFWSQRYGARGIPTTVLLDGEGTKVFTLHGAFAVEELLRALKQID